MPRADLSAANSPPARGAKQLAEPKLSAAAWFVAVLLCLSFIGLLHEPENAGAVDDQTLEAGRSIELDAKVEKNLAAMDVRRQFGLAGLAIVGLFCVVTAPRGVKIRFDIIWLLVVLGLAWAMASYAWSIDRRETWRELIRLIAFIGIGAAIARRFDPRTLCYILLVVFLGSVTMAVGTEIVTGNFRPWLGWYRLAGSLHSNSLGRHAIMVSLIAFALANQSTASRKWWLLLFAMGGIVWLTGSRTSLVTLFAGLFAVHALGRPIRETLGYLSCAATVAAVLLVGSIVTEQWDSRAIEDAASMGRGGDVTSLTGRLPLWQAIWHDLGRHQFRGAGYGAFWTVEETESIASVLEWFPRHAHSAYLETIVNVGWIGLFFLVAAGLLAVRRAHQLVRQTGWFEYRVLGAVLVAGFVNGLAEAAFALPRDLGLFAAATGFSLTMIHPRLAAALKNQAVANNGRASRRSPSAGATHAGPALDVPSFRKPRTT